MIGIEPYIGANQEKLLTKLPSFPAFPSLHPKWKIMFREGLRFAWLIFIEPQPGRCRELSEHDAMQRNTGGVWMEGTILHMYRSGRLSLLKIYLKPLYMDNYPRWIHDNPTSGTRPWIPKMGRGQWSVTSTTGIYPQLPKNSIPVRYPSGMISSPQVAMAPIWLPYGSQIPKKIQTTTKHPFCLTLDGPSWRSKESHNSLVNFVNCTWT